ncbi:hypothetical protein VTK56DRAFT_3618 [Thermocarpiscus australiensis]
MSWGEGADAGSFPFSRASRSPTFCSVRSLVFLSPPGLSSSQSASTGGLEDTRFASRYDLIVAHISRCLFSVCLCCLVPAAGIPLGSWLLLASAFLGPRKLSDEALLSHVPFPLSRRVETSTFQAVAWSFLLGFHWNPGYCWLRPSLDLVAIGRVAVLPLPLSSSSTQTDIRSSCRSYHAEPQS